MNWLGHVESKNHTEVELWVSELRGSGCGNLKPPNPKPWKCWIGYAHAQRALVSKFGIFGLRIWKVARACAYPNSTGLEFRKVVLENSHALWFQNRFSPEPIQSRANKIFFHPTPAWQWQFWFPCLSLENPSVTQPRMRPLAGRRRLHYTQ